MGGGQIYYLISLVNIYPTISMVKVLSRLWICLVGSVSLLALSIAFSKLKLFSDLISFCGQHSLLVLMIHPYVIYLGEIYFNKSNLYFYILCVLISILLTYLVQKYLPVLERGISVKKAMG